MPTCNAYTFHCKNCKKINFIKNFQAVKTEDIAGDDLYDAFMDATNVGWADDDLKRIKKECIERAKQIRGG